MHHVSRVKTIQVVTKAAVMLPVVRPCNVDASCAELQVQGFFDLAGVGCHNRMRATRAKSSSVSHFLASGVLYQGDIDVPLEWSGKFDGALCTPYCGCRRCFHTHNSSAISSTAESSKAARNSKDEALPRGAYHVCTRGFLHKRRFCRFRRCSCRCTTRTIRDTSRPSRH